MLDHKHERLIRLLSKQSKLTSSSLATQLKVSVRTIKTYVHDINELYPGCIHSDTSGYFLNQAMASEVLDDASIVPQTSKERIMYIINELIQQPMDTYELCDTLYISLSTLKNDLIKVKQTIQRYDLSLQNKRDILSISGTEVNKRKLISSILYKESNINFLNLMTIQKNFKDIDILYIKAIILEVFHENSYFINDYSLTNLVLHISIAVNRIKNHNISNDSITIPQISEHEFNLSRNICTQLDQYFHIHFTDNEIYELAILLMSRATSLNYQQINTENIYSYIDKDIMSLVHRLMDTINSSYYIQINEPEFLIRFALHIKNLLTRSQNEYFSKNPLVQEIKASCPFIYDVAVCISGIIQEETGIRINDDEIGYIAFHIGTTIEAQKELHSKVTALLCCPNYYDTSMKLVEGINEQLGKHLLIKNIVSSLEDISQNTVDLVISTIPSNEPPHEKFMQISMFLQKQDILAIEQRVHTIISDREKALFKENLEKLFSKELFEIDVPYHSEHDIIDYMVYHLIHKGYVDTAFKEQILEREKMSSTAFGNFAIPHAMKMNAKKTGIYVVVPKRPVLWGSSQVQLILMMCFNEHERYLFNEVFDPITRILNDPTRIAFLSQCRDYNDFIDKMVACF